MHFPLKVEVWIFSWKRIYLTAGHSSFLFSSSPFCPSFLPSLFQLGFFGLKQHCWFCSVAPDSLWLHGLQHTSLSLTVSWNLFKFMSIESVMPSRHLILCRPLILLTPIPPSIRVFSNESTLRMRWPKYWSFSFSIIPSKEIPGLISFRMDWLDLLAVQGTLKSLLQHHS